MNSTGMVWSFGGVSSVRMTGFTSGKDGTWRRWNFCTRRANIKCSSISAKRFPMQLRGPYLYDNKPL